MEDLDLEREERAIYIITILVLAPVVVVAIARRASFDGGTTLCLIAAVLGVIGVATSIARRLRRPGLPCARARQPRSG